MDGVAAPYNGLTPVLLKLKPKVLLAETQCACNSSSCSTLVRQLTLYVDVHVLAHALPDGVCGKAGVRARVVPAF